MDFTQALGAMQGQQPGFGLGQQLMQPGAGGMQFAQDTGAQPGMMQQLMAAMQGGGQGMDMSQLGPLLQMLQQQQAGQQQQPGAASLLPVAGMQQQRPNTAGRGNYLANGGGLASRNITGRPY